MAYKVSLRIFIDRPHDKIPVGEVYVTYDQFKAAMEEWDSPRMTDARKAWVKDGGESKVFWDMNKKKCYPPKKIMRIASRKEVRKLKDKETDRSRKEQIEKGLDLLKGGYEVLDVYAGCEAFGFWTQGKLAPEDKEKCGC